MAVDDDWDVYAAPAVGQQSPPNLLLTLSPHRNRRTLTTRTRHATHGASRRAQSCATPKHLRLRHAALARPSPFMCALRLRQNAVDDKGFQADTTLNDEKDPNNTETDKEHALDYVQKSASKPAVENMPHKPAVAAPSTVHTTGR